MIPDATLRVNCFHAQTDNVNDFATCLSKSGRAAGFVL